MDNVIKKPSETPPVYLMETDDEESEDGQLIKKSLKMPIHTIEQAFTHPYGSFSISDGTLAVACESSNLLWAKREVIKTFKLFRGDARNKRHEIF